MHVVTCVMLWVTIMVHDKKGFYCVIIIIIAVVIIIFIIKIIIK